MFQNVVSKVFHKTTYLETITLTISTKSYSNTELRQRLDLIAKEFDIAYPVDWYKLNIKVSHL